MKKQEKSRSTVYGSKIRNITNVVSNDPRNGCAERVRGGGGDRDLLLWLSEVA